MRTLIVMTLLLPVLSAPATASAAEPGLTRATPAPEVGGPQPDNYCLGGLEDRKIIVHERRVTNPFRETTRLGCQVDGGQPRTMPDLPTPSAELRLLV